MVLIPRQEVKPGWGFLKRAQSELSSPLPTHAPSQNALELTLLRISQFLVSIPGRSRREMEVVTRAVILSEVTHFRLDLNFLHLS